MIFLTTKELIEQLQREDPMGERRVIFGDALITDVRERDGASVELESRNKETSYRTSGAPFRHQD